MDVSLTVFEIMPLKARKNSCFAYPTLVDALARGDPFEFCDEIWYQKTRIVGLLDGEEIMTLS